MKLFVLHIYWRFSSENFEYGIIYAKDELEAEQKARLSNPTAMNINAYEVEPDSNGYYMIYSH